MTEISLILPPDGTVMRPRSGRNLGGTPITENTATVRTPLWKFAFSIATK